MSAEQQAKAAREYARASLTRFADRDVNFYSGFVTSWAVRNLTLAQLADLVEQLARAFPEQQWTDTGSGAGWPLGSGAVELPDSPDEN